jgi:Domain of unknown function (DUF4110)/Galactose oxidase, central domain
MGKGKKGNSKRADIEKKLALAARKEAKAEKAAQKRLNRDNKIGGDDDDDSDREDRNGDDDGDDDGMDRLLQQYKQHDLLTHLTTPGLCRVVPLSSNVDDDDAVAFPLARSNATFTATTDKCKGKEEAYLFGGEYYDGAINAVSDQLFRYDLNTGKWKQLISSSVGSGIRGSSSRRGCPPPRCAHNTVYWNRSLYVLGGEHATTDVYHHYKDLWKFDLTSLQWTEIANISTKQYGPSPRSGHAMTVWRHYMIVFGGFFEGSLSGDQTTPPRWYNDLYVFNLQTEHWIPIPHSKLTVRPEPRSGCNAALVRLSGVGNNNDDDNDGGGGGGSSSCWLIHGGFTKLLRNRSQQDAGGNPVPASETKVLTDAWILHLQPLLSDKPPTWERWTSSGASNMTSSGLTTTSARSGVGSVSYNGNMLLFGGVVDEELHNHKLNSIFYNDLNMFLVDNRKFVPIRVRVNDKAVVSREGGNKNRHEDEDDARIPDDLVAEDMGENKSDGWDLEKLRINMFSFVDGEGNVVYEDLDNEKKRRQRLRPQKRDDDKSEEEKDSESEEEKEEEKMGSNSEDNNARQRPSRDSIVQRTEPLPRIKACLFMSGSTLFVYGGILEVGDREVTLDDMWSIDLRRKRYWECIFAGTMHRQVWRGAEHDDDESYYSSSKGGDRAEEEDGDDHEAEEEKISNEDDLRKKSKAAKKEIAKLIEKYDLEDENITSQPDESLSDFYFRTAEHWNSVAAAASRQSTTSTSDMLLAAAPKDTKREGLALAQQRYEEIQPVLERVLELIMIRRHEKESKKGENKTKKSSKM